MRSKLGVLRRESTRATRALIAGFHSGSDAKNVLITTGTSEANSSRSMTLVSAGDDRRYRDAELQCRCTASHRGSARAWREVWLRE